MARPCRRCAHSLASRGDRCAALDLWRRGPESAARGRRLRAPYRRQRRSGLPRGDPAGRNRRSRPHARRWRAGGCYRHACRRYGPAQLDGPRWARFDRARFRRGNRRPRDTRPLPRRPAGKSGATMIREWLAVAGFSSVAVGAIAGHIAPGDRTAELLRTGALYGMVHNSALVALVAMAQARAPPDIPLVIAGWSFAAGTLLFSLSLFTLCLTGLAGLGSITPFCGAGFLFDGCGIG